MPERGIHGSSSKLNAHAIEVCQRVFFSGNDSFLVPLDLNIMVYLSEIIIKSKHYKNRVSFFNFSLSALQSVIAVIMSSNITIPVANLTPLRQSIIETAVGMGVWGADVSLSRIACR